MIWPEQKRFAVTLCFDLDAETAWESSSLSGRRLTLLSMGAYGRRVAVPRILELLGQYEMQAQFYIPARVAEIDPQTVRLISDTGHGIGCHGYWHERVDEQNPEKNLQILRDSKDCLEQVTGQAITHYRAPLWEITPDVIDGLIELGFTTDSSLMGDDCPYHVCGSNGKLLELPVSWLLDDWEQFAYSAEPEVGGVIETVDKVYSLWKAELDGIQAYGGHFILTMHPQLIGRPSRLLMLQRLMADIKSRKDVWLCTPEQVHQWITDSQYHLPTYPY